MFHQLADLAARYGLLGIVISMAGESCALPIPSEVVVPAGGALAAAGRLNFFAVVAAATLGNLLGSLVAYWLAARFGRPVLLGPGRYLGIRRHHVELADRWFKRYGLWAVFFGRMLPVVRTYISFPAGLAGVPMGRFIALTVVGAIPWNLGLAYVGLKLGQNYDAIARFIQAGGYLIAVVVVVILVAWYLIGRRDDEEEPAAAA